MVQTRAQRKQTDAATVAAEKATKASQANVTSWEEVQEQSSDDSSNRDESLKQSEMSVLNSRRRNPVSGWMRKCQMPMYGMTGMPDNEPLK